jgi:hypothetical protein
MAAGRDKLVLMPEFFLYALRMKSISLRSIVHLKQQLRGGSRHWLMAFVHGGGMNALLEMLRRWDERCEVFVGFFLFSSIVSQLFAFQSSPGAHPSSRRRCRGRGARTLCPLRSVQQGLSGVFLY